jgi:antitoxin ChpS
LTSLRERVAERFGDRAKLVLFGSRARGEGHEESDLDVLVWLDGASRAERREVIDLAFDVEQAFGLAVSPLVRDPSTPLGAALAAEIARDGVPL